MEWKNLTSVAIWSKVCYHKIMDSKKGDIFLLLFSGIAIIAILAASYFFFQTRQLQKEPNIQNQEQSKSGNDSAASQTQTQNETANWKTYNDQFSNLFSIKYPPSWEIDETNTWLAFFPAGSSHNSLVDGNEILRVDTHDDKRDLDYVRSEYFPGAIKTTVGGKTALIDKKALYVLIRVNTIQAVEIRSFNNKEAVKYFDKILSTFKFL